ncbi:MAG TPA: hypothetical protein EYN38_08095 [Flavobacteriales bacterium]|nr:hypothetical protein [Flavobacteriales bacterium]HIA12723.1 hypothetical protein [Flavobacteriales bacterium]HIO73046.1 hypothetical protein [Flavobacteriales bacterium]
MNNIKVIILFATLLSYSAVLAQMNKKTQKIFKDKFFAAGEFWLYDNFAKALPLYVEIEGLDPGNAHINWKIGMCYLHSSSEKSKSIPYLEIATKSVSVNYQEDMPGDKNAPLDVYRALAHAYHLDYQLDTAIHMFKKYKSFFSEKELDIRSQIDIQIKMCQKAKELMKSPVKAIVTNLGSQVNGPYADFGPVISADELTLIFTSRRKGSTGLNIDDNGLFFEDIYVSNNEAGEWSGAVAIDTNINSENHEATIGLSVDGQKLFIYKDDDGNGNIYSSDLNGEVWSVPVLMGSDINTKYWETHAVISADGKTIYFVSDRKGGFGGRDLYKAVSMPNGEWSLAQNMGPLINTAFDEDAPFIHPDGVQLFFSSNGHESMGGFDIFSTELDEDNRWSKPVNIGYPINTTDDDIYYITSVDGKRAYYSSAKPGGFGEKDIYMISLPEAEDKNLTVLTGYVSDQYGQVPRFAEIIVTNNETGELIGIYNPNVSTGKYLVILPNDGNYNISYESAGLLYHSENLYIPPNSAYSQINKAIQLTTIKVDKKIVLNNLFFNYEQSTMKKESAPEIDRVFAFLTNKPKLQIEISGHTDSKGEHDYNMKLSQDRAQAVVDALIAKGVAKERLSARGYGETQPVANNLDNNGNEDPKGMALNRRVELKILSLGE